MVLGLSGLSFAKQIRQSPALLRFIEPIAKAYANATGHRQMGLKYDDLIIEEDPLVQKAIGRLSERDAYDRAFRLRQASQLSLMHRELPKEQHTPLHEDKRYLTPLVQEVQKEESERMAWDTIKVDKKSH